MGARPGGTAKLLAVVAFTGLFLTAFWFRVSHLGAIPEHNGDESYYGLQAEHVHRGEPVAMRTASGNLLNPFLLGLTLPLHAIARPSLTLLRVPAVVSSALAIGLMLTLGARALDRPTAVIAATLLAVLPVLIYSSRLGLEQSQQPFFGVLTLAFAFLGNGAALLLAVLASLLVHPTDIFLLPIAVPVYVAQLWQRTAADPARRRRALVACGAATLGVGLAMTVWLLRNPTARMNLRQRGALDWRKFLDGLERLLFFLYTPASPGALNLHRWLFRGVLLLVLLAGIPALWRRRQTARIVLLGSLAASLAAFHVLAGPTVLRRLPTYRYGMVFVTPLVIAFACLARAFWPDATTVAAAAAAPGKPSRRVLGRPAAVLALLVLGSALLVSMKRNFFDRIAPPAQAGFWALDSTLQDPFARALLTIQDDVARTHDRPAEPGAVQQIVAHDYWTTLPLTYLAAGCPELSVSELIDLESLRRPPTTPPFAPHERFLCEQLRSGAYVVEHLGTPAPLGGRVIQHVLSTSFPPEAIRRVGAIEPGGLRIFKIDRSALRRLPPAEAPVRVGSVSQGGLDR